MWLVCVKFAVNAIKTIFSAHAAGYPFYLRYIWFPDVLITVSDRLVFALSCTHYHTVHMLHFVNF